MYQLCILFLMFLFYSFLGWGMEVIVCSIKEHKILNRGFLIGPYCPIYGIAALLMIAFLSKHMETPFALFILAIVMASILEYLTSYIMEKLFAARWWDYSHLPFNVNGRICLFNSLLFGTLGLFLIYIIEPKIESFIAFWNPTIVFIVTFILFTIFTIDLFISCNIIVRIRSTIATIGYVKKDNTNDINEKIKNILKQKSYLFNRLLNAFPHSVLHILPGKRYKKNRK